MVELIPGEKYRADGYKGVHFLGLCSAFRVTTTGSLCTSSLGYVGRLDLRALRSLGIPPGPRGLLFFGMVHFYTLGVTNVCAGCACIYFSVPIQDQRRDQYRDQDQDFGYV